MFIQNSRVHCKKNLEIFYSERLFYSVGFIKTNAAQMENGSLRNTSVFVTRTQNTYILSDILNLQFLKTDKYRVVRQW